MERSDWQDLVSRLVELVQADERRRMGSSQRGKYWRHEAWHKGLGLDQKKFQKEAATKTCQFQAHG